MTFIDTYLLEKLRYSRLYFKDLNNRAAVLTNMNKIIGNNIGYTIHIQDYIKNLYSVALYLDLYIDYQNYIRELLTGNIDIYEFYEFITSHKLDNIVHLMRFFKNTESISVNPDSSIFVTYNLIYTKISLINSILSDNITVNDELLHLNTKDVGLEANSIAKVLNYTASIESLLNVFIEHCNKLKRGD